MKSKDILQIKSIDTNNADQIGQLAGLYADVFAGPTWDEVSKCPTSEIKKLYGSKFPVGSPCPDCQTPLLEAYPKDETVEYILGELGKSNPIGLLAFVNNELAGFSWGYKTSADKLAELKWDTPNMQQVVKDLLANYGVNDELFYGSETGLDPQFQGKGIGKKLVSTRLREVNRNGTKFMVVRTNFKSPMYGICKEMGEFKQILGPVAETGWFSKKWKPTYRYVNAIDSENVDRVLFLYDKVRYENSRRPMEGGTMH